MLAPLPAPRPAHSLVRRQITLLQERSASNTWTSSRPFNFHRAPPSRNCQNVPRTPLKDILQNESTPSLPLKACSKRNISDSEETTRRMKSSYALYQCIEEDRLDVYDVPPPAKVLSEPSTPAKSNPTVLSRHANIAKSLTNILEAGQLKKVENESLATKTLPRKTQSESVVRAFVSESKQSVVATESRSQVRTTDGVSQAFVSQTTEKSLRTEIRETSVAEVRTESKIQSRSEVLNHQTFASEVSERAATEVIASERPRREPRHHQLWRRFSSFNPCTKWDDWSGASQKTHSKKCIDDKRAATLPTALIPPPSTSPLPPLVSNRPLPPTPAGISSGASSTTSSPSSSSTTSSGANRANSLSSRPWFHDVDRRRAEELVRNGVDGYFLVRPSSQSAGALTLTMWYNHRVYNISIRLRPDGRIALGTAKPNEQSFATVEEMVANYQSENLVLFSGGKRTGLTVLTTYPPHRN